MRRITGALLSLTACLLTGCASTDQATLPQAVPCDAIKQYVRDGYSPYCGDLASAPYADTDNRCIPPETHFEIMIPLHDMVQAVCGP